MTMKKEDMDELAARSKRDMARASELVAKNPSLPYITAIVMAGDIGSAERVDKMLDKGEVTFDRAVHMVGSYARLDWAIRAQERGYVHYDNLLKMLPELWRGSDPDDTDPRFLELWRDARRLNHGRYVRDGKALPPGRLLPVYRGQRVTDPVGIAWTTDIDTAKKFALGASFRTAIDGVVIERTIRRSDVMAFLTGRGESEAILDPKDLL